jgi:hypothetical protein
MPFVFAHPEAFPTGKKNAGHVGLHYSSIQSVKKERGDGSPHPLLIL